MKLASIFFTASEAIFENTSNIAISEQESSLSEWVKIHFYTQRAQTTSAKPNMKLASIFFTASEAIFENTSNIAISEQESSLSEWVKIHFYTQRAQTTSAKPNMKLASIFFTASEAIFENIYKYS